MALVSSNSNTNEVDNTAFGVSIAHTQSDPTSGDNLNDAVIYAFLASQPNSPQISQKDLEQIDPGDLEEMDLQWEMAMLTIRARRFIKRTDRKLDVNGQRENRGREIGRRTITVETPTENALIAQDRIEGYDWSYQAEEKHPINYALMAFTYSGSSSSSYYEEFQHRKPDVGNKSSSRVNTAKDYALWEVIENGNSWVPIPVTTPSESGTSTGTKMIVPSTIYVDAQSMFAAIKAQFGGNEATKKTQKALLKQSYENFSDSSSESLDSIFNKRQRLVSRLAILVSTATTKVNTATTEICTVSFSDATVYAFLSTQPQGSQLVHEDLEQLYDDGLEEMDLKWNMTLLSMRARKFYQRTGRKIISWMKQHLHGYDKSRLDCFSTAINWDILPGNAEHLGVKTTKIGIKRRISGGKEYQMGLLKFELEKVKQEKEGFEFKIAKFDKSAKDLVCPNQQRKRIVSGNNYNKIDNDYYSKTSHLSAHKQHMAQRAVLMKTGLKSFNSARPVNTVRSVNIGRPFSTARSFNTVRPFYTAHPKSTIHCART
ncbi:hypothetical protein Tco_0761517 [Tanacetum coccineum]